MKKKNKAGTPVRPQLPKDAYGKMAGRWSPGQLPPGGFRSVIAFNDKGVKNGGVSCPEPGNRITK